MTALLHATALAACCIGIHLQPPKHARRYDPAPIAIGDSVLLGAAHEVAGKGFEVDAREGRFMRNALKVLRHLKRDHRRPPVVVIAIGTNQPASGPEIRQALALLHRGQTLAFVTPKRSWSGLPSGALHDAASMAGRMPAAMVFSASSGGVSHAREEDTEEDDLRAAIEAFGSFVNSRLS